MTTYIRTLTLHAPHKVVTFVRPSSYTVKASPDYCSTMKNIHFLQLRNVLMSNTRFASKSVLIFSSTKPSAILYKSVDFFLLHCIHSHQTTTKSKELIHDSFTSEDLKGGLGYSFNASHAGGIRIGH